MTKDLSNSEIPDICVVCPRRSGTHLTIDSIYNNWPLHYRIESEQPLMPQYNGDSLHLFRDDEAQQFLRRTSAVGRKTAFIYWTHQKSLSELIAGKKIEDPTIRAEFAQAVRAMKFIYVLRDARDVAVSHCFLKDEWGGYDASRAIGHMAEWAEMATYWMACRDDENIDILFISFELMKHSYEDVIKRVGEFLGVPPAKTIQIAMIAADGVRDENLTFTTRRFRKGMIGDWINYMGDEETRYYEQHCRKIYEREYTLDELNGPARVRRSTV